MSGKVVRVDAPAKVNLWLGVLHLRMDGYHEIDSLMQTISLRDRLTLRPAGDGRIALRLTGARADGVPSDGSNLVVKAALALRERFAIAAGADILLRKEIPAGAGLGGGSSDAAAALIGLCQLWSLKPSAEDLYGLAADLGSDVPFFLRGGTARCTGRGEKVEQLRSRGTAHLVLVFGRPLSTKEVYRRWDAQGLTTPFLEGMMPHGGGQVVDLQALVDRPMKNYLEPSAFELMPGLAGSKEALLSRGACWASMSGSGSCVFGVVRSAAEAKALAAAMRRAGYDTRAAFSIGPRRWPWPESRVATVGQRGSRAASGESGGAAAEAPGARGSESAEKATASPPQRTRCRPR